MTNPRTLALTPLCAVIAFCIATAIASQAQTLTTIHSFTGSTQGGSWPYGGLIQAVDGNFYGITSSGGGGGCTFGCGTIFKITPEGTLTMLYSFQFSDCCQTSSGLIQAKNGNFYGTTPYGGGFSNCTFYLGCGTVYEITPEGVMTTVYNFSELAAPLSGVIQASDGNFYGATYYGGGGSCTLGCGTIFQLTPAGTLTTLNSFIGTNGTGPGGLVQSTDGNFYGTTLSGGAGSSYGLDGNGTVFEITSGGTLTTLYSFCGQTNCSDGGGPSALIHAVDGNFYGTTLYGGAHGDGTVFRITAGGALTTIYSFCAEQNCVDGSEPVGLMQAADGNFYGTTLHGPNDGVGTIFEITAGGTLTTIHKFARTDGANPSAGVMQAADGKFYGTTIYGGTSTNCSAGCGTVFSFAPSAVKGPTSTVISSSLNPSIYGQAVSWTATVTTSGSIPPTGKVNFVWSGYSIGTVALNSSGVATLTKSTLNADSYPLTAVYAGDANNLGSTSAVLNQVVSEATSSATLTSSPNPSLSGQTVTFTAKITSSTVTPSGPVTFSVGKTVLGTAELSGGKATFTSSTLANGSTTVTATYAGDSNIAESSASVVQNVTTSVIPPVFVMPYNGTLYLLQEGGSASATTEFGLGTSPTNFVPYYTGLPGNPNPVGEVLVGNFTAGTVINFGMYTTWGTESGWAFSTGTDEASIVAFSDPDDNLGMGGSITQQTSSTTWLLHLDDALSYLVDDDDNDVLMQIRVAPTN